MIARSSSTASTTTSSPGSSRSRWPSCSDRASQRSCACFDARPSETSLPVTRVCPSRASMSSVFRRRASRSTSCSAALSSRSSSALSAFADADSSRSRSPVSGVLSWCEAFETNSRWAASTVPIRSVMSLKAIDTSRCSVAPVTSARASRSPSSTRLAVAASLRRGRESESARNHASTSPRPSAAAPIAARASTLRRTRSCTEPTLCVTRTAPATRPPSVTGTALYRRSSPSVSLWRVP
jgi:hypothetical protein